MEDPWDQIFPETYHSEEDEVFPDGEVLEEHVVLRTEPQALSYSAKNIIIEPWPVVRSSYCGRTVDYAQVGSSITTSCAYNGGLRDFCVGNWFSRGLIGLDMRTYRQ
jgi:hypothetical protein